MIYNFNQCRKYGITYYEINNQWKYTKLRIKNILDCKHTSRDEKILEIQCLLDDYKRRYLK